MVSSFFPFHSCAIALTFRSPLGLKKPCGREGWAVGPETVLPGSHGDERSVICKSAHSVGGHSTASPGALGER